MLLRLFPNRPTASVDVKQHWHKHKKQRFGSWEPRTCVNREVALGCRVVSSMVFWFRCLDTVFVTLFPNTCKETGVHRLLWTDELPTTLIIIIAIVVVVAVLLAFLNLSAWDDTLTGARLAWPHHGSPKPWFSCFSAGAPFPEPKTHLVKYLA